MKPLPLVTAVVLASCCLRPGLVAGHQDSTTPQFEDKVEVTEVLLDVIATNKKGEVIRGLGPDDFRVIEDGKAVEITGVSFYTTRYTADDQSGAGGAIEVPASRYFILFFEDQKRNASPANRLLRQQLEAARESHNWVRDEMKPSDWVAVLAYDTRLTLYQDFTQDRDTILYAIDQAVRGLKVDDPVPSRRKRLVAEGASLRAGLPHDVDLGRETRNMYDALRVVAEASSAFAGRKNLLLFTIGFGRLEGTGPFNQGDPRYYPAMEQALNANNVAVYPIDLMPVGVDHSQTSFLNELAFDSGGVYQRNLVSFSLALRRIDRENAGYYLLAYRTAYPAGTTGYRDVEVKALTKKVRVRARRGFRFGASEGDQP